MSKKPTSREKQTRREFKHADAFYRAIPEQEQALQDITDWGQANGFYDEPRKELEKAA
jgi:hypothetical protein